MGADFIRKAAKTFTKSWDRHRLDLATPTLFTTELEEVIEIIARERVYRAMLAGLGRRLLMAPAPNSGE